MSSRLAFVALAFLIGCNSNNNSGGTPANNHESQEHFASYQFIDQCSTGRQAFKAPSEKEIQNIFCEALKDETRNNGCALYHRHQAFKEAECPGVWPHENPTGTNNVYISKRYAYQVNECSTGLHFFAASRPETLLNIYCMALNDDSFNRNCAKDKREEAYRESECDKGY